jgi:hypothetical protein
VRVALIWERAFAFRDDRSDLQTGYQRQVGADVPLAADGPTVVTLAATPPTYEPSDIHFVNSGIRIAEGLLVAYEDVKQNRQLDLQQHTSEGYADHVVAYNRDLRLIYAEGLPDEGSTALTQRYGVPIENGFAIVYSERDAGSPSPFSASPAQERLERFTELGHTYELAAAPRLSGASNPVDVDRLMCEIKPISPRRGWWSPLFHLSGRPPVYPTPYRGENRIIEVVCAEDGSFLEERRCDLKSSSRHPCSAYEPVDNCSSDVWYRPDPAPSDWPCP